ncbi:MAG: MBOAT family protein [Bacillati bacterium ANGP1]|uniref:MBOAT family protein n=1 Tax=Candidatus Segetimicrobium genomatis TaxID=2569760 RepID=A0A537J5I0_9BACT|nr:MAG: MBOAT family protein [Terrabacteria group bacterium ANGP1]
MLFNSLGFLFVFLPITYLVFWRLTGKLPRYASLAISGYVFYAFWNYKFCALMLFSTGVSYLAGLGLLRWQDPARRRLCVVLPVVTDLALLGFFKYGNFAAANINGIASWLGGRAMLPILHIVLPVGISFYTFHTITYIIDSYRRVITPTRNFIKFAAYVSLFPQLVAGPIVRFRQIEQDFENIDRAGHTADADTGWSFFVIGMVEKVLIADTIAAIIDPALARYAELSTASAWLCAVGFAYQVYFDFAGYSDMAIGLGYLFGFRIPQNFNSPYKATDMADLWRRWHISLSSFFRDYVYIPLGGSRFSRLVTSRNLMITMLLCGLWHGAAWTYVVFGAYQGALLVLHQMIRGTWDRLPLWARRTGTFGLWVVGLTIFRATGFEMTRALLGKMFVWHAGADIVGESVLLVMLVLAAVLTHWGPNSFELSHRWSPAWVGAFAVLFGLVLVVLYGFRPAPYIYFQF